MLAARSSKQLLLILCYSVFVQSVSIPRFQSAVDVDVLSKASSQDQVALQVADDHLAKRQDQQLQSDVNVPGVPSQAVINVTSSDGSNGTHQDDGVIANNNYTSPQTNCRDLYSGRDNKCWKELDLSNWVRNWLKANPCNPAIDTGFSDCFTRQALKGSGIIYPAQCSTLKPNECTEPQGPYWADHPEIFYVFFNIHAINQFFLSWWTAVGNAGSLAALNVDSIVTLLAVPDNTNFIMDNILIALTGLFCFAPVGLAAIRGSLAVGSGTIASMQLVENAIIGYPQIGRFLFPVGGPAANIQSIADLKTELNGVLQQVQNSLNKTLVSVMGNVDEFLAFAETGNFTHDTPSLPDQSNYLLYGFNTYIVSQALAQNDIHAVLALDTNPQQLATNGTKLNYDINCKSYNEQGVCGQWWWDSESNIAYGLDDFRHMNRDMNKILSKLLSDYTTGDLLFVYAYACNAKGQYGLPINVTVNAAGVDTSCLSQLQTLRWDMRCSMNVGPSNSCEFLDGPPQNGWLGNAGSHSGWSVMDDPIYSVPRSYLGPLLNTKKYQLKAS